MLKPQNKRIYLSPPHLGELEQKYVADAFASNWIAPLGEHVDRFELELAGLIGSKGALAVSSGTAAIHLSLRLLGVGPGDTVFCSSLTFIASASPITYLGAEPVFIDSESVSWNMSPDALERAFLDAKKKNTLPKAVIIVNIYGQSADMDPLIEICSRYGVPVVEDAAESLGAIYKGKSSGSFGEFGVFSFNGNKIITTSGGGMLVSDNLEAIAKARFWATQARDKASHYQHSEIGYNYRLSNILAAIGRGQLQVLSDRITTRKKICYRYRENLAGIAGISFMPEASFGIPNYWLTVITVDPSKCGVTNLDIMNTLEKNNIEARPLWKPLHLQPVFNKCTYYPYCDEYSVSERLFAGGLCLPSGSSLSQDEQKRIINIVKDMCTGKSN
jgi:pyridoxal phosphate-dependent aminotransferase EpsN